MLLLLLLVAVQLPTPPSLLSLLLPPLLSPLPPLPCARLSTQKLELELASQIELFVREVFCEAIVCSLRRVHAHMRICACARARESRKHALVYTILYVEILVPVPSSNEYVYIHTCNGMHTAVYTQRTIDSVGLYIP